MLSVISVMNDRKRHIGRYSEAQVLGPQRRTEPGRHSDTPIPVVSDEAREPHGKEESDIVRPEKAC